MEFSELTVDVEKSISDAYNHNLPIEKQEEIAKHFIHMLGRLRSLRGENALIQPIQSALAVLQTRIQNHKTWRDWLLKPTVAEIFKLAFVGVFSFIAGVYFPDIKSKFSLPQEHTQSQVQSDAPPTRVSHKVGRQ